MAPHPFKGRSIQVKMIKDDETAPAVTPVVDKPNYAEDIQETVRIISAHVVMGVGTYVLLDTFRKVVVKMVPGR